MMGIVDKKSSPWTPEAHGPIERAVRTARNLLRACGIKNLEESARRIVAAHNSTVNAKTGYSPFQLMFGRTFRSPLAAQLTEAAQSNPRDSVVARTIQQQQMIQEVKNNIAKTHLAQDKHLLNTGKIKPDRQFNQGDLVVVFDPEAKGKMDLKFVGPYRIVGKITPQVFQLRDDQTGRVLRQVNIRRLLPFVEPSINYPIEFIDNPSTRTQIINQTAQQARHETDGQKQHIIRRPILPQPQPQFQPASAQPVQQPPIPDAPLQPAVMEAPPAQPPVQLEPAVVQQAQSSRAIAGTTAATTTASTTAVFKGHYGREATWIRLETSLISLTSGSLSSNQTRSSPSIQHK